MRLLFLLGHFFFIFFSIHGSKGQKESPHKCFRLCPNTTGWEEKEDRCYLWPGLRRSWIRAEKFCNEKAAHLASVSSLEIHNYIRSKVDPGNDRKFFWVGGTDRKMEGKWMWTDGSAWNFEKWATSPQKQPDNAKGEHCLQIYHPSAEDGWNDKGSCQKNYVFFFGGGGCLPNSQVIFGFEKFILRW